jgi:protein involved in polysaccharide export with SLBB domain
MIIKSVSTLRIFMLALEVLVVVGLLFVGMTGAHSEERALRIGDIIAIALPGEETLTGDFQIDRHGEIQLPEVGGLKISGQTLPVAANTVRQKLGTAFRDIGRLSVRLKESKLIVAVGGQVKQPGTVELPGDANVQVAIAAAGGVAPGAQLDGAKIIRGSKSIPFNYKKYLDTGDSSVLPKLEPLDVIFMPTSPLTGNVQIEFDSQTLARAGDGADEGKAIAVFGEVINPAKFSYKANATIVDMLMRAGGVTRYAAVEQIRIIADGKPVLFNLQEYLDSGSAAKLPPLQPGATIFVPIQVEQIRKGKHTVYVMGEVAKPGAFELQEGATFVDILANSGGPTRYADTRQIRILRGDGKVSMFDMVSFTEGKGGKVPLVGAGDAILVPEKVEMIEPSWLKTPSSRVVQVLGAVYKPGRYEWSDEMSLFDLIAQAGGPSEQGDLSGIRILKNKNDTFRPVVFDLAAFIKNGGTTASVPKIKAGNIIVIPELPKDPTDNKAQWLRQDPSRSIYIMGAVGAPGRYAFDNQMGFLDLLSAADGPIKTADLRHIRVSARGGKVSDVRTVDFSRYLETGDESLLPRLKTGDVVFVPDSEQEWVERSTEDTVRVIGAVAKPGRYKFSDRMSILDLLAEAGGPSEEALQDRIIVVNMGETAQASYFDLVKFSRTGDFDALPVVRNGDTVYVPDKSQSHWNQFIAGVRDVSQVVGLVAAIAAL